MHRKGGKVSLHVKCACVCVVGETERERERINLSALLKSEEYKGCKGFKCYEKSQLGEEGVQLRDQ